MTRQVLIIALSTVWLLAGAGKLAAPGPAGMFLRGVTRWRVTGSAIRAFAVIEIIIGIGLSTPQARPGSALASLSASVAFLAILLRSSRGQAAQLPCGCFGPLVRTSRVGPVHVGVVLAMIGSSAAIIASSTDQQYLGLQAQAAAVAISGCLVVGRYLWLRRAVAQRY